MPSLQICLQFWRVVAVVQEACHGWRKSPQSCAVHKKLVMAGESLHRAVRNSVHHNGVVCIQNPSNHFWSFSARTRS